MAIEHWKPVVKTTKAEEAILARLKTHRKLFAFLRLHRHEILDDDFQELLASMYRDTGAGASPQPPALMCMVLLLQEYDGVSDREAVERSVIDARWRMVLDCLGDDAPAFSQGGLQQFRERLIAKDMDIKLLERTVEVARRAKSFDWKKLPKMRQGVAADRRVSIEDEDMRHGRKSKSHRFNGYKEHIASDLDHGVILACAVTAANVPEEEAAPLLKADIEAQGYRVRELDIDRGYLNSKIVDEVEAAGGEVLCKPWPTRSPKGLFTKQDFVINARAGTITCPAGEVERFEVGATVEFDPEACGGCRLRAQCTHSASGRGRTIHVADDESRQQRLRELRGTPAGRMRLRRRTHVEHDLAHIAARKGRRARYRGKRKNTFHLRRTSAVQNLEAAQRAMLAS